MNWAYYQTEGRQVGRKPTRRTADDKWPQGGERQDRGIDANRVRPHRALGSVRLEEFGLWERQAAVPHGFRSSFRDWAAEETDHPREVIEATLAHVVRNWVEAAYARSDLFERRRVLMDDWARYLAQGIGCRGQARVLVRLEVPGRGRREWRG